MKHKKNKTSPETIEQAQKVAKATQRPGQTKEQTKLIAQGIQKGIEQYKKQQKSKARELDKKLRKVKHTSTTELQEQQDTGLVEPKSNWLPWGLLIVSWFGFVAYYWYMQV
ncbi:DUF2956 domain-containing protein [Aliikangiella sp. IMCC44359]|uniref:DUF2956 domain-containing protein n=1 Tax=Aliikangiella sp. IMCC44359 TaxID=3459125 RepID=UPI00403B04E7